MMENERKTGRPRITPRVTASCETCGGEFERLATEEKKFCSRKCYYASVGPRCRGQKLVEREERPCERCGTVFLVGGPGNRTKAARFCSRSCAKQTYWDEMAAKGADVYRPDMKGVSKPRKVDPHVEKKCEWCETAFMVGGSGSNFNKRFCSKSCARHGVWRDRSLGITKPLPNAHNPAKKDISEGDCKWIAGVLDGEGNISWSRKSVLTSFTLTVANTNFEFLERINKITQTGTVLERGRRRASHSPLYVWSCGGQNAKVILEQIYPYLIVKREAAEVALGLREAAEAPKSPRTLNAMKHI